MDRISYVKKYAELATKIKRLNQQIYPGQNASLEVEFKTGGMLATCELGALENLFLSKGLISKEEIWASNIASLEEGIKAMEEFMSMKNKAGTVQ
jgi:hypothetical protein